MKKNVTVKVPASSGNLGPGFDVVGFALGLRNELRIKVVGRRFKKPLIQIIGEGFETLPRDQRNLIFRVIKQVFQRARQRLPALEIICLNRIPLARGLGSSSAAYLAALLGANRILHDRFSKDEILRWATELEGHPDNVAAALLGGVRASVVLEDQVVTTEWPVPELNVVVAVPAFELSTKKARKVLPAKISMTDAVWNLSAVALLPEALGGRTDLLRQLLNDRWHERYRAKLIPGFFPVKQAALKAGALGTILSGAGPTMLSFVEPRRVETVGDAMKSAFMKAGVVSAVMGLEIDRRGAIVQ